MDRAKQKIAGSKGVLSKLERLVIKSAGEVSFVKLAEIDWIEAADYYAALHVGPKTHLLRRSICELEQDLVADRFCRIHRSTIVNLERVRALKPDADGEYRLVIHDGTELRLSRRYRKQVQSRLGVCASD
jgi:two-component system, LytTR family, response regulator